MRTYYEILGVEKTATADEIKNAYRTLAKKHHPDTGGVGGSEEEFKSINEAYSTLIDATKRQQYNAEQEFVAYKQHSRFQDGMSVEDIIANDFFHVFGMGNGMPFGRRVPRNSDIRVRINLSLESIVDAQEKSVTINTGKQNKALTIKIPAGIRTGAVINFKGMGQNTHPEQLPGNLLIEIVVDESPSFQRIDNDLLSDVTVTCFEAVLGCSINFTTIRKKVMNVVIPAGTQTGTLLRLPLEGLPAMNDDHNIGGQLLRVNIAIPTNLTADQLKMTKEILDVSKSLNN